jgi:uncharacterized protein (TIGR03435 family)
MFRRIAIAAIFVVTAGGVCAQDSFEVAAIKLADPEFPGRTVSMQGAHLFSARNQTLRTLIGAAYNLTPRMILSGPGWADSEHYDIVAETPGEARPETTEQMSMLQNLLVERFKLTFHRELKELPIYEITVSKTGLKLTESKGPPSDGLHIRLSPGRAEMPGRHVTIAEMASVLQRAALDRPVVDRTGLTGKYDFDLDWTPDESQFGGIGPRPGGPEDLNRPDLFTAIQQQLGLKLEAVKGRIEAFVIDHAERPSAN